jgi:2-keto-4-pentenoate hydratase
VSASQTIDACAAALREAYETRAPIEPPSETYPGFDVDAAYAVQLRQVDEWLADGAQLKGHKVGLTSVAMQRQLGVDEPDFGHLLDGMFHLQSAPIPAGRYLQPRIEPEIAFVLAQELRGPGVTTAEAARAVAFVLGSLEVIDSRVADWRTTITDTIADNASCGGVVLGVNPVELHSLDLALVGCNLYRNGELVGTGAGGAVLGHPLVALTWLANTLGERGVSIAAGQVVLPGACMASVPVSPGDVVTARFQGLGRVTARFAPVGMA